MVANNLLNSGIEHLLFRAKLLLLWDMLFCDICIPTYNHFIRTNCITPLTTQHSLPQPRHVNFLACSRHTLSGLGMLRHNRARVPHKNINMSLWHAYYFSLTDEDHLANTVTKAPYKDSRSSRFSALRSLCRR